MVDANDLAATLEYELIPSLEKAEVSVIFNKPMRYMHVNGTMFIRVACKRLEGAVKSMNRFNEIIYLD